MEVDETNKRYVAPAQISPVLEQAHDLPQIPIECQHSEEVENQSRTRD